MDNYEFCVNWVTRHSQNPIGKVLDYGCGAGQIVGRLRRRGVQCFGCDSFYEGGDSSPLIRAELESGTIVRMEGARVPFGDSTFDIVVNNQVMEHVVDLDEVLGEVARVLKPGGRVLSLFPDRGVWREGHCGIPLLHRFRTGSRFRVYYAAAFRAIGCGYHKGSKTVMEWSEDFCEWLDSWTHYRSRDQIERAFAAHFSSTHGIEADWLMQRLNGRATVLRYVPRSMQQLVVRKLAGLVLVSQK